MKIQVDWFIWRLQFVFEHFWTVPSMQACKPSLGLRLEIAALGATLPSSGFLCSLTHIHRLFSAPFPVPRSTVKCCRLLFLLSSFIFCTLRERMGSNSGIATNVEKEKYIYFCSWVGWKQEQSLPCWARWLACFSPVWSLYKLEETMVPLRLICFSFLFCSFGSIKKERKKPP